MQWRLFKKNEDIEKKMFEKFANIECIVQNKDT